MAKVSAAEGLAPRAMDMGAESGEGDGDSGSDGVRLKKELSLMNGVAIIVGVIVGSGIFVSPSLALKYAGSKGMALIVWVLSGFLSMIGALCYAELGTMIPKSGGDYAYIGEAFGPLLSFLYLWVALFVLVPTGNAITALTFAQNILQPLWPDCTPPQAANTLIAAIITCFLTVINCYNVKWVTRVQDSFTAAKILAFVITFIASLWYFFTGHTENLQSIMQGTNTAPGDLAIAFYTGLFSYSGWNYLNFVTEELKEPYKNLPRAICISMPVVTLVYALTNVAYFAVLTNVEINASQAVAVTFSEKILGVMSWIMPLFVAMCTFGSLNGAIYASSRLFFVGARNGHLPLAISLIDIRRLTPVPSLIFMINASQAVAVTFSEKILGVMSWIMPLFVAMCTFGSLNGAIYASSRLFFVGARNGHLPLAISLIDIRRLTPVPSLIFMCVVTLVVLLTNNVESLIVYVTAVEALFTLCSVAGLLWMRYKRPTLMRPIRVNLLLPIAFLIICTFLVVFSCFTHPQEVGIGIAFTALGVPIYFVFIHWQNRPQWLQNACNSFNVACSKLFLCLPENSKEL